MERGCVPFLETLSRLDQARLEFRRRAKHVNSGKTGSKRELAGDGASPLCTRHHSPCTDTSVCLMLRVYMLRQYKRSKQRDAIFENLQGRTDHPTAQDVHRSLVEEFPTLSLGTVYRNLNILVDQQLIRRLDLGGGTDRFEARTDPHYHFICLDTGEVIDLDLKRSPGLEAAVKEQTGFEVQYHRIDFFGSCSS